MLSSKNAHGITLAAALCKYSPIFFPLVFREPYAHNIPFFCSGASGAVLCDIYKRKGMFMD